MQIRERCLKGFLFGRKRSIANYRELEFKTYDKEDEEGLKDTVQAALEQIEKKQYSVVLTAKGIPEDRIYKYGFAFEGKKVLIG